MSTSYYRQTLKPDVEAVSLKCSSFAEMKGGLCTVIDRESTFLMGGDLKAHSKKPYGIFYLETKNDYPNILPSVNMFTKIRFVDEAPALELYQTTSQSSMSASSVSTVSDQTSISMPAMPTADSVEVS